MAAAAAVAVTDPPETLAARAPRGRVAAAGVATRAAAVGATRVTAADAADTAAVVRPLLASEVKVERVRTRMCPPVDAVVVNAQSDGHTVGRKVLQ